MREEMTFLFCFNFQVKEFSGLRQNWLFSPHYSHSHLHRQRTELFAKLCRKNYIYSSPFPPLYFGASLKNHTFLFLQSESHIWEL